MVKGLEIFRNHFKGHAEQYILIGGTACDLLMSDAGLPFRATKDLDLVLCVEALDTAFFQRFWDFIKTGGYQVRQKGQAEPSFYRFTDPNDPAYPQMIELFARKPAIVQLEGAPTIVPIPAGEEASSLSAILMDDACYAFLMSGIAQSHGVRVANATRLIPLKALAWKDLRRKKVEGGQVDSRDIKKHANDVYRLSQLIAPATREAAPEIFKESLRELIAEKTAQPPDLVALKITGTNHQEIHKRLADVYSL